MKSSFRYTKHPQSGVCRMKHKNHLLTCFTAFYALLCFVFCSPAFSANARFSSGKSASVPIELVNNHIYVRVSVSGSRTLSFILDTGTRSIIHTKHARSIGLKLKLIGQAGGVGA